MARTTSVSPDASSSSNGDGRNARDGPDGRDGPEGRDPLDRPAGRAGRRRALPSGRAVGGGFVIAVAVVITFAGWIDTHGRTGTPWVVAAAALPVGTRLTAADLTTTTLRLGRGPAATDAFATVGSLLGRELAVAVTPGELILRSEVPVGAAALPLRPVPVTVPPTDLVDLAVGDLVDVLESPTAGAPTTTVTVVVRGARVLSTTQPSGGLLSSGGSEVVTLGVATLAEVTATVIAEHAGTLDVVVGEPSDGSGPGAGPS